MKKEAIEYSRLVRMFCTPPPYPLSDGEKNALKKADTFTVRFEGRDLPCTSWGERNLKFGDGLCKFVIFIPATISDRHYFVPPVR